MNRGSGNRPVRRSMISRGGPASSISLWGVENPHRTWRDILKELVNSKRALSVREVAELSIVSRGNAWIRLDRMRMWGMVKKVQKGSRVYWIPTEYGKQIARN